jgi:hypothetical protein
MPLFKGFPSQIALRVIFADIVAVLPDLGNRSVTDHASPAWAYATGWGRAPIAQ